MNFRLGSLILFVSFFAMCSTARAAPVQIKIRAYGTPALSQYPIMELHQGTSTLTAWTVTASTQDYFYSFTGSLNAEDLRVAFVNDLQAGGEDRDLFVESLTVGTITYRSDGINRYSTGTWDPLSGCTPGYKQSSQLHCNGAFEYPTAGARPSLSITSPAAGATLKGMAAVQATATSASSMVKVEFFADGLFAFRTSGLPYTYGWDTSPLADGSHRLTVRAVDLKDQAATVTRNIQVSHAGLSTVPTSPSRVHVSGRQLLLEKRQANGSLSPPAPFLLKGITWSPAGAATKHGFNPFDPNNPAGYTEYGFFFDWPGRNPQGSSLMTEWLRNRVAANVARDLPLINQMNANTVRLFNDLGSDPATYKAVLDEFYRRGVMVVMTIASTKGDFDSGRHLATVALCKNHPAILMWALGNEWNLTNYYGSFPDPIQATVATEQAAQAIKALDPNHPVSSSLGDRFAVGSGPCGADAPGSDVPTIVAGAPSIDLWALNVYRGASFSNLFSQWQATSTKPLYLSEFGTDTFFTTSYTPPPPCVQGIRVTGGAVNQAQQASYVVGLWNELKTNLSANDRAKVAVGGFVHEFSDEIWKVGNYNAGLGGLVNYDGPDGIPGTPDDDKSYGSYNSDGFLLNGLHPDHVANEEHFGAVKADRQPKQLYNSLKTTYAALQPDVTPPSIPTNVRFTSRTSTSLTVAWNASTDNFRLGGYRLDVSTTASFGSFVPNYADRDIGISTRSPVVGLTPQTTYFVRVRAYDAAGNVSGNSVTRSTVTLPMTSSISQAVTPLGRAIRLEGSAANSILAGITLFRASSIEPHEVDRMEFFVDGQRRTTCTSAPCDFSWNSRLERAGQHLLEVRVTFKDGESSRLQRLYRID